jgi:hypothetical protein
MLFISRGAIIKSLVDYLVLKKQNNPLINMGYVRDSISRLLDTDELKGNAIFKVGYDNMN